jgi:hypothetical protein
MTNLKYFAGHLAFGFFLTSLYAVYQHDLIGFLFLNIQALGAAFYAFGWRAVLRWLVVKPLCLLSRGLAALLDSPGVVFWLIFSL